MREIIVTGASGFIGSNLSRDFRELRFAEVLPLSLWSGVPDKLPPGEVLIHLAGIAHDLKKTNAEALYYEVNFEKTKVLFDRFLRSDLRDFFFFSSVKAVADSYQGWLTEEAEPKPATVHGKSKLCAEEYLLRQAVPEGKRVYIIRPCMTHGPLNKGNLNLLFQFVNKGVPYPLAAFENERSFLSIDNLIFLLKRMIEAPSVPSGVYHFADDESLSTNELIRLIAEVKKKPLRLWKVPKSFMKALATVGDVLHLPLTTERLQKMTESYLVSNRKIKTALGIQKLPVTAEEGMRKTIESLV